VPVYCLCTGLVWNQASRFLYFILLPLPYHPLRYQECLCSRRVELERSLVFPFCTQVSRSSTPGGPARSFILPWFWPPWLPPPPLSPAAWVTMSTSVCLHKHISYLHSSICYLHNFCSSHIHTIPNIFFRSTNWFFKDKYMH
jgi:hypothetical protein